MNYIVTIISGIEYTGTGRAISPTVQQLALEEVRQEIADLWGGYTETVTIGGWNGPDGHVQEEGRKWEILVDGSLYKDSTEHSDNRNLADPMLQKQANNLARFIRRAFWQTSVVLQINPTHSQFVSD